MLFPPLQQLHHPHIVEPTPIIPNALHFLSPYIPGYHIHWSFHQDLLLNHIIPIHRYHDKNESTCIDPSERHSVASPRGFPRSEEHTSELQSRAHLLLRLLL